MSWGQLGTFNIYSFFLVLQCTMYTRLSAKVQAFSLYTILYCTKVACNLKLNCNFCAAENIVCIPLKILDNLRPALFLSCPFSITTGYLFSHVWSNLYFGSCLLIYMYKWSSLFVWPFVSLFLACFFFSEVVISSIIFCVADKNEIFQGSNLKCRWASLLTYCTVWC